MRSSKRSLFITLVLLLSSPALSAPDEPTSKQKVVKPCTLFNPSNGNSYDLNAISVPPLQNHKKTHKDDRSESWHSRGWDYGVNFTINFCAPVIEHLERVEGVGNEMVANISAFYRQDDRTYSIGQMSTKPIFRGRKLVLNYTDGSPCDGNQSQDDRLGYAAAHHRRIAKDDGSDSVNREEAEKAATDASTASSHPVTRRKSSLFSFSCDREPTGQRAHVSFIGASPDQCSYFFEVKTAAACGGIIAQEQSLSPGGVFGFIAVIAAAVYLLGGIAYQRTVMHQRGWRQVPNYSLWAGIFGFFKDIFIIVTSSCTRCIPRRRGYNQLSSRSRRDDEANGLIDSYDEEY